MNHPQSDSAVVDDVVENMAGCCFQCLLGIDRFEDIDLRLSKFVDLPARLKVD